MPSDYVRIAHDSDGGYTIYRTTGEVVDTEFDPEEATNLAYHVYIGIANHASLCLTAMCWTVDEALAVAKAIMDTQSIDVTEVLTTHRLHNHATRRWVRQAKKSSGWDRVQ